MTQVLYILGRTDNKPSMHTLQFIRETNDMQLERFVTTGMITSAKHFRSQFAAMKFLVRTRPSITLQERNFEGLTAFCYEILILDTAGVLQALAQGKAPQSLKGSPLASRVFCSTLQAERPP